MPAAVEWFAANIDNPCTRRAFSKGLAHRFVAARDTTSVHSTSTNGSPRPTDPDGGYRGSTPASKLGYVRKVAVLGDAALKTGSECSFTTRRLRFLACFCLA